MQTQRNKGGTKILIKSFVLEHEHEAGEIKAGNDWSLKHKAGSGDKETQVN